MIDLAYKNDVYIGGDDFKSGQTKLKSVLVDYFVRFLFQFSILT